MSPNPYLTASAEGEDDPAAPDTNSAGYVDLFGNGSVYIGGDAKSGTTANKNLDSDTNNFAKVLPYGNTHIIYEKLTLANSKITILDTQNFALVADDANKTDLNGKTPKIIVGGFIQGEKARHKIWMDGSIAYIGGLKAYLSNTEAYNNWVSNGKDPNNYSYLDTMSTNGYTNVITAEKGGFEYLYRFTFPKAAILPDGSLGTLEITTTAIEMESSIDIDPGIPIGIQGPNCVGIESVFKDTDGNGYIKHRLKVNGKNQVLNAFGLKLTFDIRVLDSVDNPVDGTISYATTDLDMSSKQSLWGRPAESKDEDVSYMYAEGYEINSGAMSYAIVPKYNHDGVSPLRVTNDPSAATQGVAKGVRFTSADFLNKRNDDHTINSGAGASRDDDNTFDTGFAVLLDSKKTTITWTGSHWTNGQMNTTLLNNSVFTFVDIKPTSGAGSSIYVPEYVTMDSVTQPAMTNDKTIAVGLYSSPHLIASPDTGYRVKEISVGVYGSTTLYKVVYNSDGKAIAINDGNSDVALVNDTVKWY